MRKNFGMNVFTALLPFTLMGCAGFAADPAGYIWKKVICRTGGTLLKLVGAFLVNFLFPRWDAWSVVFVIGTVAFLYYCDPMKQIAESVAKWLWYLFAITMIGWAITKLPKDLTNDVLALLLVLALACFIVWVISKLPVVSFPFKELWKLIKKGYEKLEQVKYFNLTCGIILLTGLINSNVVSNPGDNFLPAKIAAILGLFFVLYKKAWPRFTKWYETKHGRAKGPMTEFGARRRKVQRFLNKSRKLLAPPQRLPQLRECPVCHKMGVGEGNFCCLCAWEASASTDADAESATETTEDNPSPDPPPRSARRNKWH